MKLDTLCFIFVLTCVYVEVNGVDQASSKRKEKSYSDKSSLTVEKSSRKNSSSFRFERDGKVDEKNGLMSNNITAENVNQLISRIINRWTISSLKERVKSLNAAESKLSQHFHSPSHQAAAEDDFQVKTAGGKTNSSTMQEKTNEEDITHKKVADKKDIQRQSVTNDPKETGLTNSQEDHSEISTQRKEVEGQKNERKSKLIKENTKEPRSNRKSKNFKGKGDMGKSKKRKQNNEISTLTDNVKDQKNEQKKETLTDGVKKMTFDAKTSVLKERNKTSGSAIYDNRNAKQKQTFQTYNNMNSAPPVQKKRKQLKTEKDQEIFLNHVNAEDFMKAQKTSKFLHPKSRISYQGAGNGNTHVKRAKKLLMTFFDSESSDEKHAYQKKTHVGREKGEKKTITGNVDKAHVAEEHDNENAGQITKSDTHDQESTLAEISDKLDKRTRPQLQPQITRPNAKVIETVLPSGPSATEPQHIRLGNQQTHVLFKPIHRYLPVIHRYMTKPIHRYLKKPIDLQGGSTTLDGEQFTEESLPQVKEYTAPPGINHIVGRPQVADRMSNLGFGGLRDQVKLGLPVAIKGFNSMSGHQFGLSQVEDAQQGVNSGRVVNSKGPDIPRIVQSNLASRGLLNDNHIIQDARHVAPIKLITQLPPRLQPVLIHPHRLSPSGFGPCSTNPCKNSGVCSTVNDQAMCICKPGFRGQFCEMINKCFPNPCHNYGSCTEIEKDFECSCKKGFRGKRCEVENKCEPNPCNNGGSCSEMENDYVCSCREGFFGHSCEAESKCSPINPCKNGATCQEARNTYKCLCRDGFGGYNCEARVRRNICLPNPCQNGGFCTITGTSTGNYTCSCAARWKGPTCAEKIDYWGNSQGPTICESVNPCMYGGKCTPVSYYDYTCTCPHNRGGAHCEQDLSYPKFVSSCDHCHAFARCLDDHCLCKEGYEGDGVNCQPVQQFCHPNPCYNGGVCKQSTNEKRALSGGKPWWCECQTGYKGRNCQDMDLCLMRLCQNGGTCISSKGQTGCLCPPTYSGKYCQEKDVCHGKPCKNGGSCKAVEGVVSCLCPVEYEGTYCQQSRCSTCDHKATCIKGNCICLGDYVGDGKTCRKAIPSPPKVVPPPQVHRTPSVPKPPSPSIVKKYCSSNPCANGATCLEALETYFCQCPENKFGKQCDHTPKAIANLCEKCDIEATCKDGRCVCNKGFNGNGFTCKKSTPIPNTTAVAAPQKTDSSCDFCPDNGECLDNVCVCPPGFESRKRSCVAIDVPRVIGDTLATFMTPENSVMNEYQSLGCWADTKDWRNPIMRALQSLEGLHPFLNDEYKKRKNPIRKCATAAKAYGYKVFAIQNGGQCFSDADAEKTYTTYGPSSKCRFGVGGALANDVYKV